MSKTYKIPYVNLEYNQEKLEERDIRWKEIQDELEEFRSRPNEDTLYFQSWIPISKEIHTHFEFNTERPWYSKINPEFNNIILEEDDPNMDITGVYMVDLNLNGKHDIKGVTNHRILKYKEEPGILRLNLTLYFLFAAYAAAYNPKIENPNILAEQPKFVADLTFTADKYGPQDYSVNDKLRNEYYQPKKYPFTNHQVDQNVKHFIDDILEQLKDVDDFSLLDRAVQDDTWLNAYTNEDSKLMSKEQMMLDYQY